VWHREKKTVGVSAGYRRPDRSGFNTVGGYSTHLVVKEHFVLSIPEGLDVQSAARIPCACITTYSPLHQANLKHLRFKSYSSFQFREPIILITLNENLGALDVKLSAGDLAELETAFSKIKYMEVE
jgi:NADPH:quinone reductase-like Zn-dependent oxidoreductase